MANTENEHIVHQMFENYLKGDVAGVFALLDPEILWVEPGETGDIPFSGVYSGFAGIETMFAREAKVLKVTSFKPKSFFSNDDMVVVLGEDSANVIPTGKSYTTQWSMAFTLANGKITRVMVYMDTHAIAKAFV